MLAYALIPARSGSKGLPHKNVLELCGHPLLAYSIAFAKKIAFDRILVSTDAPAYQQISIRYGAECPYLRSAEASSDEASEHHIFADLTANLPRLGIPLPDLWVRLKPTNPFRSVSSVNAAITALAQDPTLDSVRIVSEIEARLHVINSAGFLEPWISGWEPRRSTMSRSKFPTVYNPFNLDVSRHAGWVERGLGFMGHRIKPIVEHKITGIDINDQEDFDLASALIALKPRPAFMVPYVHEPS